MISSLGLRALASTLLLAATCAASADAQGQAEFIVPGDRVLLRVTGEPQLTDTFTVDAGSALDLPALGSVPLAGVRRDSIEACLTTFLSRFLNHPLVRAEVLVRLGVVGEVARPGYYALPAGAMLEDLVMAGGGLSPAARFDHARFIRDRQVILDAEGIQHAVAAGATLGSLGLRSGDALDVPKRPDQESRVRILTLIVGLPLAVFAVTRLF